MHSRLSNLKVLLATLLLAFVAGCSSNSQEVETALSQPTAQTNAQSTNTPNQTSLASEATPSAAETVTNAQTEQKQPEQVEVAALNPAQSMTFLPVEGAPQGKVSTLSKSLQQAAATHNLNLVPGTQGNAAYQVKGYFSALNDGSGTLLVYIWDVMDKSGNRLHRINGQERSSSLNTDPWQSITDVELKRVADTTAARLKSWVQTR